MAYFKSCTLSFKKSNLLLLVAFMVVELVDSQSCERMKEVRLDGDIILGGMFNIHEEGEGGQQCGRRINPQALQRLEAFLYAVDIINKRAILREKIGISGFDTCDSAARATNIGLELLSRRSLNSAGETCSNSPIIIGSVGDYNSETTAALASLMTSSKLTQISYAATATSLTEDYPYFVRTVPSASFATKALLDIIQELGWKDVGVVAVESMDTTDRKLGLLNAAGGREICVVSVIDMASDMSNIPDVIKKLFELKVRGISGFVLFAPPHPARMFFTALEMAQLSMPSLSDLQWIMGMPFVNDHDYNKLKSVVKGLISIQEESNDIEDFKKYFTDLNPSFNTRNPWFREYWEQTYNCTVGVTCGRQHIEQHRHGFMQAHGVSQTIAAVFTYVNALQDARKDLCPQSDAICPALRLVTAERMTAYIKSVSFINMDGTIVAFNSNGDLSGDTYSISNVQLDGVSYRTQHVGYWNSREGLQLKGRIKMYDMLGNLTATYPTSFCRFDCSCHNQHWHFSYGTIEGGESLLHGFFDIHGNIGELECNSVINEDAIQALEAFYFAIDHINSHPRILPHIKLGVTTSDSCRNTGRAKAHVQAILTKKITYKAGLLSAASPDVSAVLDATTSDVTLTLAEMLGAYGIPHVSTTATVAPLSDKKMYPTFLRTIGMNTIEVRVLINIIREFKWDFVKLVFSDDAYGKESARDFLIQAMDNSICVATQVELSDHIIRDTVSISNIVRYYMLEAFPSAKVVVLFLSSDHINAVFNVMDTILENSTHDLVWLSGHQWGTRPNIVRGHSKLAHGAITIDFKAAYILPFIRYFTSLRPASNHRNPWFQEFWQNHFQCHLSSDFAKVHKNSCDPKFTLVNDNVAMSTEVPYVIDGVYTYALALHKLLEDFCGINSTTICQAAEKNMDLLYIYMKEVKFYNGLTNMTVSFDALGNGASAFKIFNYQMNQKGQFMYTEVGHWTDGLLSINKNEVMGPLTIGRPTKANMVRSSCDEKCVCSTSEVTELQYEVQYARLTLLGYFPIHKSDTNGMFCSKLRLDGFAANMAFQYAIQRVNNDPHLLPNITLGYMIFDTCSDADYTTRSFNAFDKNLRFFGQSSQLPVLTYVHAFIGGVDDNVTKSLNTASYNGQRLVQISPYSSSATLSDKEAYPYFLRTVSSEENEALILLSLLRSLGWNYISLVKTSSPDDSAHTNTIHKILSNRGICIATIQTIPSRSHNMTHYQHVVRNLLLAKGAFGVVLVLSDLEVQYLFEAVQQMGAVGRLYWLGTTRWQVNMDLMERYSDVSRGALQIFPNTGEEPYLDAFIQRLRIESPSSTTWIREFWQEYFQCRLDYGSSYTRVCDGTESLQQAKFSDLPLTISTINAVYAFAYGLTALFEERCGGMVMPPCDAIISGPSTSTLVYDYIKRSHFLGPDGKYFSFTQSGDAEASYVILNYQDDSFGNKRSLGRYVKVGSWSDDSLMLNRTEVHLYDEEGKRIELRSVCPGQCNCSEEPHFVYRDPPPLHMATHLTVWGIIVLAISLLGVVLALITAMFFMLRYRHPVVLGSTSSLSLMLIAAISSLYLLNFAFMLSDTAATCAFRRLFLGIFFAIIFSVLLIKVIRIGRICNKAALSSKPSFISGQSQTAIALLLSFIQVALAVEWLIVHPPGVTSTTISVQHDYEQPIYMTVWNCNHSRKSLVISLSYVYALVFLTFIYAFRARKAANYQHEALCILLTSVSIAIILSVWATLYTMAEPNWAAGVACIAITGSASTVFAFVFTPKMLILTAVQGGSVHSETSTNNIDYPAAYPVAKTRERENTHSSSFRNSHPFPLNELSEQNVYSPYTIRQSEAF